MSEASDNLREVEAALADDVVTLGPDELIEVAGTYYCEGCDARQECENVKRLDIGARTPRCEHHDSQWVLWH